MPMRPDEWKSKPRATSRQQSQSLHFDLRFVSHRLEIKVSKDRRKFLHNRASASRCCCHEWILIGNEVKPLMSLVGRHRCFPRSIANPHWAFALCPAQQTASFDDFSSDLLVPPPRRSWASPAPSWTATQAKISKAPFRAPLFVERQVLLLLERHSVSIAPSWTRQERRRSRQPVQPALLFFCSFFSTSMLPCEWSMLTALPQTSG